MAIHANVAPAKSTRKKANPKSLSKSGRGQSRPVPLVTSASRPLVVAASKPRNPVAVDALLKKSGPHDDKRRAQKIRAQEQLQTGLDEVRKRNADD